MWQVAAGAGAVQWPLASDGNVSWHVRARPNTAARLLSTPGKGGQREQQMAPLAGLHTFRIALMLNNDV